MGKNLKGREIEKGICQRKDGKYSTRYISKDGSRREKHFDTLPEARNWLADSRYEDKHNKVHPMDGVRYTKPVRDDRAYMGFH